MKKFLLIFLLVAGLLTAGMMYAKNSIQNAKQNRLDGSKRGILREKIADRLELSQEKIDEFKLQRLTQSTGLEDLNQTDQYIEEEIPQTTNQDLNTEQISYYQTFVTPNDSAVRQLAAGKNFEQAYQTAVSWLWVEDQIINGEEESWLSPNTFITQTPTFSTNPSPGNMASDCESQAYTLVSMLRAVGMPAENVRVVTGKVNFGGSVGGHAWVEVFDENTGEWFQLEATTGSYYDSEKGEVVQSSGVPYNYFQTYQYPSIQVWTYFNDQYFWDNNRVQGNAPEHWLTAESGEKRAPASEVIYQIPNKLEELRTERERRVQEGEAVIENREDLEEEIQKRKVEYLKEQL